MSPISLQNKQLTLADVIDRPVSRTPKGRKSTRIAGIGRVLCWAYLVATILTCILLRGLGERWWPITLLLYGPRWVGLLPLPLLAMFALLRRRLLVVLAAGAALYAILVMGLNLPVGRLFAAAPKGPTLRLLTLNAHRASTDPIALANLLDHEHPDVVLIQDYTSKLEPAFGMPGKWNTHRDGELFIASRFALEQSQDLKLTSGPATAAVEDGRDGVAVRYILASPFARLQVIGLHLASPHTALGSFIDNEPQAAAELTANSRRRLDESSQVLAAARGQPTIIAGDFNTLSDSPVFRTWSSFSDAFAQTTFGLGYTHFNRWSQIRIDHILAGRGWRALRCWVGPAVGSAHRPLLADLEWTGQLWPLVPAGENQASSGLSEVISACFWAAAAGAFYTYALYPALIWLLSRKRRITPPELPADATLPAVSILIAAHNEQAVIEQRIANALKLDYPADRMELVIASDGSSDRTAQIVAGFTDPRVRLLDYPQRRGKAAVLNDAVRTLRGDIVILSDANTDFDPSAARFLVRWFADRRVGVVCGKLVLFDHATGRNADGLYWRYETFLKECEGRLGALLGSNGAIYAIRRGLFPELPRETIVDDFVIPLLAKLESDCAIRFDSQALAREEVAPEIRDEFRRRARIGAGGFQAIVLLWRLLDPRRGWIALSFFSHKVLRWICPFLLLITLLAPLARLDSLFYRAAFLAQALLLVSAPLFSRLPGRGILPRLLRLGSMFVTMNAALFVGFFRWLSGQQRGAWTRTLRDLEVPR